MPLAPANLLRFALTAAFVTAAVGTATPAAAASSGVVATYGATRINLAAGWGGAQSCVVSKAATTCYATAAEADTTSGTSSSRTSTVAVAIPSCSAGWLCLWEHTDGGGRRLMFQQEGWQSLAAYGFAGQTSSWRNNQACNDLALLGDGQGSQLNLGYCSYGSSMGAWNDRATDVGA